jgi:hypothetical protein
MGLVVVERLSACRSTKRLRDHSAIAKRIRAEDREGMRVTTVVLREGMHRRLAIAATEENTITNELLRRALSQWLAALLRQDTEVARAIVVVTGRPPKDRYRGEPA